MLIRPLYKPKQSTMCPLTVYHLVLLIFYHVMMGLFTKEWITVRKPFWIVILTLSWFCPSWTQSSFNQAFETRRKGVLSCGLPRTPDSEDLWTQSSFGTWFVSVPFGNARWNYALVNLHSRNKILPHSAQILFVIGTAVAMLVNTR